MGTTPGQAARAAEAEEEGRDQRRGHRRGSPAEGARQAAAEAAGTGEGKGLGKFLGSSFAGSSFIGSAPTRSATILVVASRRVASRHKRIAVMINRRSFLKIGSVAAGGAALPELASAEQAEAQLPASI